MMVFKKVLVCATLSALVVSPQTASSFLLPLDGSVAKQFSPLGPDGKWKVGKTQSPLKARSSEVSPVCVSVDRTVRVVASDEFDSSRGRLSELIVRTLPRGDRLACRASGGERGDLFLFMQLADYRTQTFPQDEEDPPLSLCCWHGGVRRRSQLCC